MMKALYAAAVLGLFALNAYAQSEGPTPAERIRSYCNAEANKASLKSDKRKAFVSACVKKVPDCVASADEKKVRGTDYINAVSTCVHQK